MRKVNEQLLKEALNYNKSMSEAFLAGTAAQMVPKILAVLGRRLGVQFTLSPFSTEYINHLGKFSGYYAGFSRTKMIRINFQLHRSDTIISVDYFDKPSAFPKYTIDMRGFNIVQVLDMIADVINGTYFAYVREGDEMEESTSRRNVSEGRQAGKGHPTLVLTWLRDNPEVVASLRIRGKTDFDAIRNVYGRYARTQGENPNINMSSFRVYISKALKILNDGGAADNVPVVAVTRGSQEQPVVNAEREALYNSLVVENPAIIKMKIYINHLLQIKAGNADYRGLYVFGQGGIGKSHYAKSILKPLSNCYYASGGISGYTGLLKMLFEHRNNEIIVLDDIITQPMMKSTVIQNILKAALDTDRNNQRHITIEKNLATPNAENVNVNYNRSLNEMPRPTTPAAGGEFETFDVDTNAGVEGGETMWDFDFNSTIVILTNYAFVPQPIEDRCWVVNMSFKNADTMTLLRGIYNVGGQGVSAEDLENVFNYVSTSEAKQADVKEVFNFIDPLVKFSLMKRTPSARLIDRCLALYLATKHGDWKKFLAIELGFAEEAE